MAIKRIEHVDMPFAARRVTPNRAALAALYVQQGQNLAEISLRKGENTARLFDKLGALYTGYTDTVRQNRAAETAMATRSKEREQDRKERQTEREATAAERRAEQAAIRSEREAVAAERRGAAVAEEVGSGPMSEAQMTDVLQGPAGGRARYVFGPGTAEGPELTPTVEQARVAQSISDVQAMGGTIGPNGQVIMPTKPMATKALQMQPAMVNGRRTFVRFNPETGETLDFAGRPVDAQPIPPQAATATDNEPLETIIGPDGKAVRVRRRDAVGKAPAAGTEKPSSGVQKRVLNFFNRAEQADKDLESMETDIQKLGLLDQSRMESLPNFLQTQQGQSYQQAQRAFTEARLRKDSGAAIPEQEFKNDRQTYFAQPGDTPDTLEQKRRARAVILASLGFESGQALGEFLGDSAEAARVIESYRQRAARPATNDEAVIVDGFTVRVKPKGQ